MATKERDDADEQQWIELLIANERVQQMIDAIRKGKMSAVLELRAVVEQRPAYAEEARRAGVVQALTRVLATTSDEAVLDAAAAIITACSGHMACGGKVRSFDYDGVHVDIKEGALGDGLGAKVWTPAHTLARELVKYPQLVKGKRVLEIGAGCGLNGIVAAKLGAAEVVMTDVEGPVLHILAQCMIMNAPQQEEVQEQGSQRQFDDKELFEEAEEVDDFDLSDLLGGDDGGGAPSAGRSKDAPACWDMGKMSVRLLDWAESMQHMDGGVCAQAPAHLATACQDSSSGLELPPRVPPETTYEIVLGNEVMYEPMHARLVAAAVAHKLAPGGAALLCCAVRDLETFSVFKSQCQQRGLRHRECHFQPSDDGLFGVMGHSADYEGGFRMMAVDHVDAVFQHWHRDNFE